MRRSAKLLFTVLVGLFVSSNALSQSVNIRPTQPDLSKQPTLYVVGYAHLDTQWRWEYPQVINEYLPKTMHDNFALFEKYPNYVFNFSGANRYRMIKEYWPSDYLRMKQYIAAGRWFPAGSSMEESDVNSPRPNLFFDRFFMAIITSVVSSARQVQSTCCRIASVFRRRCPASWPTQVSRVSQLKN